MVLITMHKNILGSCYPSSLVARYTIFGRSRPSWLLVAHTSFSCFFFLLWSLLFGRMFDVRQPAAAVRKQRQRDTLILMFPCRHFTTFSLPQIDIGVATSQTHTDIQKVPHEMSSVTSTTAPASHTDICTYSFTPCTDIIVISRMLWQQILK